MGFCLEVEKEASSLLTVVYAQTVGNYTCGGGFVKQTSLNKLQHMMTFNHHLSEQVKCFRMCQLFQLPISVVTHSAPTTTTSNSNVWAERALLLTPCTRKHCFFSAAEAWASQGFHSGEGIWGVVRLLMEAGARKKLCYALDSSQDRCSSLVQSYLYITTFFLP